MKLRYSPRALGDLAAISDYLIERSPAGARAVEETIRTTVRMLEQFPSGGRALRSIVIALDGYDRHPRGSFRFVAAQRQDRPPRRMVAMHLAPLKCGENPCL
jgi:plasmid stabilization system protein ParE